MTDQEYRKKLEELELLEQKHALRVGLPFLYGWNFYPWARKFYESTNRMNLLCAANQISKSSTQIRKAIDWATNREKWPLLWRTRPYQFWYLYPSMEVATVEFEKKWRTEFLPKGKYKDDPVYGWKEQYNKGYINAIHFNSGVSLYFKSYSQKVTNLQTATIHAVFADEELPEEYYDELMFRLAAVDGYFHMVFTATLGQEIWRRAMEEKEDMEKFPFAFKQQISMYDCLRYEDGSETPWTLERIERIKQACKNDAEIQRRVYGKFVIDSGLVYPSFSRKRNMRKGHPIPENWQIYSGVDVGSGGENTESSKGGHPSAIVFVAVNPEHTQGRVFKAWRGDGITTTAGDTFDKYIELKGHMPVNFAFYDWAAKDFSTIAQRAGESFQKAEKSHDIGEGIVNTLFKMNMLHMYTEDPEIEKLATELTTIKVEMDKRRRKDDLADALRYAVTKIPWDWSQIVELPPHMKNFEPEEAPKTEEQIRRAMFTEGEENDQEYQRIEREFEEWQELLDVY